MNNNSFQNRLCSSLFLSLLKYNHDRSNIIETMARILMKYSTIGLGGTFDHFHDGHASFINFASKHADELLIGVTSDKMTTGLEKDYQDSLQTHDERARAVKEFCKKNKLSAKIFQLDDIYGPTISPDSQVDALCFTAESRRGVTIINFKRQELGLEPLPLIEHQLLEIDGKVLKSTDIRAGFCDRQGRPYSEALESDLKLSPSQRRKFKKPFGKFVIRPDADKMAIVVGDSSLLKFRDKGWEYDLGVIDYLINRETYFPLVISPKEVSLQVENLPGTISIKLLAALKIALEQHFLHVQVIGEEDLAAVALILLAPLKSRIYYGQPGEGLVKIVITEKIKEQIKKILLQ